MTRVGLCESCFDEGSCCCNEHCYCLIDTLYYSAAPVESFVYANNAKGTQSTALYAQTDDLGRSIDMPGSVFVSSSTLNASATNTKVQEEWVFNRVRRGRKNQLSANALYDVLSQRSPNPITYAVSSGLGKYEHAKKLIVTFRATTNIYEVKVYA